MYFRDAREERVLAAIDLRAVRDAAIVDGHGALDLVMSETHTYGLRATTAAEALSWLDAIQRRKAEREMRREAISAAAEDGARRARSAREALARMRASGDAPHLNAELAAAEAAARAAEKDRAATAAPKARCVRRSGTLKKRKPGRSGKWQERYVSVDDDHVSYFAHGDAEAPSGQIAISGIEWVRPFSDAAESADFELRSIQRVFHFRAASAEDMRQWVTAIAASMRACRDERDRERRLMDDAATPRCILDYDAQADALRDEALREALDGFFTDAPAEDGDAAVGEALQRAGAAIDALQRLAAACEQAGRQDVLLFYVRGYHERISAEVGRLFVVDDSGLSQRDMHALLVWVGTYAGTLRELLKSVPHDARPPFELHRYVGSLVQRFTHGRDGRSGNALSMRQACERAADAFLAACWSQEALGGCLLRRESGIAVTSVPGDMWKVLNAHLDVAVKSGSPELQAATLRAMAAAVQAGLARLRDGLPNCKDAPFCSLEYLCAAANDATRHMEAVDDALDSVSCRSPEETEGVRDLADDRFGESCAAMGEVARVATGVLASIVMADVASSLEDLFGKAWADGAHDGVGVAIATVEDYMQDIRPALLKVHRNRLASEIGGRIVLAYVRMLLRAGRRAAADRLCMAAPASFAARILGRRGGGQGRWGSDQLALFQEECDALSEWTDSLPSSAASLKGPAAVLRHAEVAMVTPAKELRAAAGAQMADVDPAAHPAFHVALLSYLELRDDVDARTRRELALDAQRATGRQEEWGDGGGGEVPVGATAADAIAKAYAALTESVPVQDEAADGCLRRGGGPAEQGAERPENPRAFLADLLGDTLGLVESDPLAMEEHRKERVREGHADGTAPSRRISLRARLAQEGGRTGHPGSHAGAREERRSDLVPQGFAMNPLVREAAGQGAAGRAAAFAPAPAASAPPSGAAPDCCCAIH